MAFLRSSSGYKFSLSFDEATMIGLDRYLTINVHHKSAFFGTSRIAPLGLVRITESATGEYLRDIIVERLNAVGLSRRDFVAAATDGGKNVLKAVTLMGLNKQACFAHGLDLVVRKVVFGPKALAFDVDVLQPDRSGVESDSDDDDDDEDDDDEDEDDDDSQSDDVGVEATDSDNENEHQRSEYVRISLGKVVKRLRKTARKFKRSPKLMDELRRTTAKEEFNRKSLRIKLDCRTRWYSTFQMIERALLILPALNSVLCRFATPIPHDDALALRKIAEALQPFKRAIVTLCSIDSTLSHADKVFLCLLNDLQAIGTELADILSENVISELRKRRTILSSVLGLLEHPGYEFKMEQVLGHSIPSDEQILQVLEGILDPVDCSDPPNVEECSDPLVSVSFKPESIMPFSSAPSKLSLSGILIRRQTLRGIRFFRRLLTLLSPPKRQKHVR